jgi:hypothetical protein
MKRSLLFLALTCIIVGSAMSQGEVPPVVAQDDSMPVLGSVMLDPSNTPLSFHSSGASVILDGLSFDFSGSARFFPHAPAHVHLTGTASVLVEGSGMYKDVPLVVELSYTDVVDSGGIRTFATEMLSLQLTLPSGTMLRESPTLQSKGKTSLRESPTLPRRESSFFDVFTELSLDGGGTWTPADGSLRLEMKLLRPPVTVPVESVIPQGVSVADLDGDGIPDLKLTNSTTPAPPVPPVGGTQTYSLTAAALVLVDGLDRAPGTVACVVRATGTFSDGTSKTFATEMLQLDLSGGTLPPGMQLRESPTLHSTGQTTVRSIAGGQFQVSSFFDVFTELSLDGGQTWTPRAPATLELTDTIPAASNQSAACVSGPTYPNDLYPFQGVVLIKPPNPNHYGNSWVLRDLMLRSLSPPSVLPALGATQVFGRDDDCDGQMDMATGAGFTDFHATCASSVSITHSSDNGDMRRDRKSVV